MSSVLTSSQHRELLKILCRVSCDLNMPVFLIGGVVRDLLSGRSLQDADIDLTVEGDAFTFATAAQPELRGELKQFSRFLTAKILNPESFPGIQEVDFATCRTEIYTAPGKLPEVSSASLREDLRRRDFTINAIAISVNDLLEGSADLDWSGRVVDLFGGLDDLREGKIRVLHAKSFEDDPTRIFRAIRYSVRLEAELEESTDQILQDALSKGALETISNQRIFKELQIACEEAQAGAVISRLCSTGVLAEVEPFCLWNWDQIQASFSRSQAHWGNVSPVVRWATGLAILFRFAPECSRVRGFIDLGMSRKGVLGTADQVEQATLLKVASDDNYSKLSDIDLLTGVALSSHGSALPALIDEIRQRKS